MGGFAKRNCTTSCFGIVSFNTSRTSQNFFKGSRHDCCKMCWQEYRFGDNTGEQKNCWWVSRAILNCHSGSTVLWICFDGYRNSRHWNSLYYVISSISANRLRWYSFASYSPRWNFRAIGTVQRKLQKNRYYSMPFENLRIKYEANYSKYLNCLAKVGV